MTRNHAELRNRWNNHIRLLQRPAVWNNRKVNQSAAYADNLARFNNGSISVSSSVTPVVTLALSRSSLVADSVQLNAMCYWDVSSQHADLRIIVVLNSVTSMHFNACIRFYRCPDVRNVRYSSARKKIQLCIFFWWTAPSKWNVTTDSNRAAQSFIKADKIKWNMQEKVQVVGAKPAQVPATELHPTDIKIRLTVGRTDTVNRHVRRVTIAAGNCECRTVVFLPHGVLRN